MSTNNYNNLISGIKQVKPIEIIQNRIKIFQDEQSNTSFRKDETDGKMISDPKNKLRYIRMDNFMKPGLSNLNTIEDIKRKIKTGKITFDNRFDKEDEEDEAKFIKIIKMTDDFVYGVDTREYNPKNTSIRVFEQQRE